MGRAEKEPRRGFSVVVVKNEHGSQTYFELHHCLAQYNDLGHVSQYLNRSFLAYNIRIIVSSL